MSKRAQQIFVFIFVFSVFSLTLQASIINICKESKILKTQSQQNPVTEEEEESHGDETPDKEVLYLGHHHMRPFPVKQSKFSWEKFQVYYSTNSLKILIPPPER